MADSTELTKDGAIRLHDNGDGTYSYAVYNIGGGGGGDLSVQDEATFAAGTSDFTPAGGVYNDSLSGMTSGD